MIVELKEIDVKTKKHFQIIDITDDVKNFVEQNAVSEGTVTITSKHTTAAIRVNENEPLLFEDIQKYVDSLAPCEGHKHDILELRKNCPPNEPKNAHSHLKALLMGVSETIPVKDGKLSLGRWQRILFIELDGPRTRTYTLVLMGK
jgi:secondary thiamine-phosphate synthase enzyme